MTPASSDAPTQGAPHGATPDGGVLRCDAVLFDLDGVLADSLASVERHWTHWARAHDLDVDYVLAVVHGRRAVETIRLVAPALNAPAEVAALVAREAADSGDVLPVPGARALLDALPAGRWGIVTSGTRVVAEARLAVVGITPPAVLVTADDVGQGKPHPEGYLEGARRLGVAPARCVVVEDAAVGVAAAHAAGMRVLGVATNAAETLADADVVAASLGVVRVRVVDGKIELRV